MYAPPGNPVGWFEIPVIDMERAMRFYEAVFRITLTRRPMGPRDMAMFPMTDGKGASGALVKEDDTFVPATKEGTLVYFTAYSGDVDIELRRAEEAGGRILVPKKSIGDYGWVAYLHDTEGNRIALHCRK